MALLISFKVNGASILLLVSSLPLPASAFSSSLLGFLAFSPLPFIFVFDLIGLICVLYVPLYFIVPFILTSYLTFCKGLHNHVFCIRR